MNRLKKAFEKLKKWILYIVTTRFFYYESDEQSVNLSFIKYKIRRRKDVAHQYGQFKDVEFIYYRRSKLKGYEYINLNIAHYIHLNIDLHKPI